MQLVWSDEIDVKSVPEGVDVDRWWSLIDRKIVEASAFSAAKQEVIQMEEIAPWIPPVCRSSKVVNMEMYKGTHSLRAIENVYRYFVSAIQYDA